jgi:hypothetical protein
MKNLSIFLVWIALVTFMTAGHVFAQDNELKNYIWSYEGKNKPQKLGAYLSMNGVYHALEGEGAGLLGMKGALVWNSKWGVGLMGQALWYDKALSEVVSDGTYHLQAGMAGLFVSYTIPIHDKWRISMQLASGTGVALYQYDKDSREGKTWYGEIIDRDTFSFLQPTIEVKRHIGGRWWLGAEVSYRSTSEINLTGLPSGFLSGVNPGISLSYGLF